QGLRTNAYEDKTINWQLQFEIEKGNEEELTKIKSEWRGTEYREFRKADNTGASMHCVAMTTLQESLRTRSFCKLYLGMTAVDSHFLNHCCTAITRVKGKLSIFELDLSLLSDSDLKRFAQWIVNVRAHTITFTDMQTRGLVDEQFVTNLSKFPDEGVDLCIECGTP
ncbi:hypothetical protein PFISCL1PPCAC_29055, partial [Pristionchus fissidentatus]